MKKPTNELMVNLLGEAAQPMKLMSMGREDYFVEMMKPRSKYDIEKPVASELLDEAGVTNEEFAEQALSNPALWQSDEIELFEAILAGEPVDRRFLSDLYEEVITGRRTAKTVKESATPTAEEDTSNEKDPEEIAEEKASSFQANRSILENPPVIVSNTRSIDTTGWWKK